MTTRHNLAADAGRLIAVGDVHGCIHGLEALLTAIDPQPCDEIVFLGDLVDQGANSREVLNEVQSLTARCRVVLIEGNHEEMMLRAAESVEALRFWERCGGVATLNSYRFGGGIADVPAEHWQLLATCRPAYETADFIFTHANYLPDVAMSEQPGFQLRWALFDPAEMRPHVSGKPVIVGHTEQISGEVVDLGFAKCIDTAGWRYGWITALEPRTNAIWQASRWGVLREPGQPTPGAKLKDLFQAGKS